MWGMVAGVMLGQVGLGMWMGWQVGSLKREQKRLRQRVMELETQILMLDTRLMLQGVAVDALKRMLFTAFGIDDSHFKDRNIGEA